MDEKMSWVEVLLVLTCFAGAWAVMVIVVAHVFGESKIGDAATWFGSFGTMATVAGAYLVGERQAASARRQASDEYLRRQKEEVESIAAVLDSCKSEINRLLDEYPFNGAGKLAIALDYEPMVFSALISALTSFNLATLRSSHAVTQMLLVQQALIFIQKKIEEFKAKPVSSTDVIYGETTKSSSKPLELKGWKLSFNRAQAEIKSELLARLQ